SSRAGKEGAGTRELDVDGMYGPIPQSGRGKKAETVIGAPERVEQILAIHIGWRCGDKCVSVVNVYIHSTAWIVRVPGPALNRVTPGSIVDALISRHGGWLFCRHKLATGIDVLFGRAARV